MTTRFVLFDLDNTVVDSLHLKSLRDRRRWPEVYSQIPTVAVFDGIREVWRRLQADRIHLGVVTHSPSPYARRVLAHIVLSADILVAYHELKGRRKPSPYGYELACVGRGAQCGIAVGDERNDLLAAQAFGCAGVFAGWCREPSLTPADCERDGWVYATHPHDVLPLVDALPA